MDDKVNIGDEQITLTLGGWIGLAWTTLGGWIGLAGTNIRG